MATENSLNHAIQKALKKIRGILAKSKVPEDPIHAEDTLKILLKLCPQADISLQIAALGHDIERAFPRGIKVERQNFSSYDAFKKAHSQNSARLLRAVLLKCNLPNYILKRVYELVLAHEFGGTPDSDLLKDADSLSFFHVNLPLYAKREPKEEVLRRVKWGIERLSPRARSILEEMAQTDQFLRQFIPKSCTAKGGKIVF
ncbi:hypothetical protein DBT_2458 [Dissulfuribacter thermophilus]|uniref:DUF4202 family protein n=1 Tax=Dissulfuribacter thermophilus TaxID=1156395 RepID=A0A1B9F2U4_9BACT|nr:DUF4202 family protein [Dissulfuribacter thermophilus]OCC14135.1 hypothetical protein DBT_2458 [Dissulfuribacter thermophilus]